MSLTIGGHVDIHKKSGLGNLIGPQNRNKSAQSSSRMTMVQVDLMGISKACNENERLADNNETCGPCLCHPFCGFVLNSSKNGYQVVRTNFCPYLPSFLVTLRTPGLVKETSNGMGASTSVERGSSEKHVSLERCAELTIIVATHGLKEAWISNQVGIVKKEHKIHGL
ncbi:hypothetical protein NE237_020895 [Protea cynaroides]|uniref:Uncharacterized protein n=1 Tax=Protea cynaroides TaxID=273540 RepID=A0A9Q0HA87_9MAGN|nr:hypothetical protein NE237_020895 [Protea cynaroides]